MSTCLESLLDATRRAECEANDAELSKSGYLGRSDRQELVGRRFGRLVVLAEAGTKNMKRMVSAQCDCGSVRVVRANCLLTGNTKSCGCGSKKPHTHGHAAKGAQTRTYRIWCGIISRANGRKGQQWYADRGITVCERWRSYENFLADMGEAPDGMSIDRIDNDKDYEPANCRWATSAEQSRNRRGIVNVTINGETMCVADWCRRLGLKVSTVYWRVTSQGKTFPQAMGVE